MKLIHCADIHLGSTLSTLPKELAEERKADVKNSFSRMVNYARQNGISVILLSGDVFDREKPLKKELNFFNAVIAGASDIDFLYLRGNHDAISIGEDHPNLKFFSDEWRSYTYGDVTVSGIEIAPKNAESYHSTLSLNKERKNIVMLHGQTGTEINLTRLRDKNIDYLALGHVHKYTEGELDGRGTYVYCGCLEGRGFDETGEKGFVVLDTDGIGIYHEFHPFSHRIIEAYTVDVSGLSDTYNVAKRVNDTVNPAKNGIYRIILTGEVDADTGNLAAELKNFLAPYCTHLSVKDETRKRINYENYRSDLSLKGEFVRAVQASNRSEEEKIQIITYGLKALMGEKPE